MPDSKLEIDDSHIPIPKVFFSDLTGVPIDQCISCECDLIKENKPYLIEKALKPYDGYQSYSTVFEYAICMPCAQKMQSSISKKSKINMQNYFSQNASYFRRAVQTLDIDADVMTKLDTCMIKNIPVKDLGECQIYAQCIGDRLIMGELPYMISGEVLDEVVELLSAQTLDDLDRFKDEVVGGPSEFQDLLQSGPKVFI